MSRMQQVHRQLNNSQNILNVNLLTRNDYNFPNYPHKSHRKHFLSSGFRRTKPTPAWGHGRPGSGNRKQKTGGRLGSTVRWPQLRTIVRLSRQWLAERQGMKLNFALKLTLFHVRGQSIKIWRGWEKVDTPQSVQIVISGQFLPGLTHNTWHTRPPVESLTLMHARG